MLKRASRNHEQETIWEIGDNFVHSPIDVIEYRPTNVLKYRPTNV